jgi:hypothetical protein
MVEVDGVEPECQIAQNKEYQRLRDSTNTPSPQIDSQSFGIVCPQLARIFDKWDALSPPLKQAIVAIVDSAAGTEVES